MVLCNDEVVCPPDPPAVVTAPVVTPAQAAERAVELLPIVGPRIGVAPGPQGAGLVGLPVWLWTVPTSETWGPIERTASVTGLAVTARARATQITWDMGDGHQVVCAGPGTAYDPVFGGAASPDCGHRYTTASGRQPAGRYTITATTSWTVDWWVVGGGAAGVITTTRQSQTSVRIDELQVVTR